MSERRSDDALSNATSALQNGCECEPWSDVFHPPNLWTGWRGSMHVMVQQVASHVQPKGSVQYDYKSKGIDARFIQCERGMQMQLQPCGCTIEDAFCCFYNA